MRAFTLPATTDQSTDGGWDHLVWADDHNTAFCGADMTHTPWTRWWQRRRPCPMCEAVDAYLTEAEKP